MTSSATLVLDAADAITRGEEVHHPDKVFTEPEYAAINLRKLAEDFHDWQQGRANPIKPITLVKYRYSLKVLFDFMADQDIPLELRYLHPTSVEKWVKSCRGRGLTEDSIASTLTCVKVFANQFITKQRDLCLADPLRKVERVTAPEKIKEILTEAEIEQILSSFGDITFEDIRNRAFVAVLLSTGARIRECRELTTTQWDASAARLTFFGKGDKIRYGVLGERALKCLQRYLRMRPKHTSNMIWLCRDGAAMKPTAWQMMFRRLKIRSGVPRVHAHLMRHTFGSVAILKGAERAAVQDMMGHASDFMTQRYTRQARRETAAAMMPHFAPI